MKEAWFIPCFISSSFPEVGVATLQLLERLGCEIDFPFEQTCCGQPLANEGDQANAAPAEANFLRCFADEGYDYTAGPLYSLDILSGRLTANDALVSNVFSS